MSGIWLRLDPIGGVAGDMFVAALLDAWPELAEGAVAAVRAAGLGDDIAIEHRAHRDGVLVGSRFAVTRQERATDRHDHVLWRDLRTSLASAPLDAAVRGHALAIFALLAEAEASVHGVEVDAASFHEVGAWDSIADIVAAAFLIEAIGAEGWSVGALPLGGGRVRSAHGELPVPAPATAALLAGFTFHDDGRPGERVTPTGAAILKHLNVSAASPARSMRLQKTGHGFGQRTLQDMSNVLRVLAFETVSDHVQPAGAAGVAVLSFEVDDQTPEDLAIGLDRLRALDAVLDLVQTPVFGKKGRLTIAVRALVKPDAVDAVLDACFAETTTLGVRWHVEQRVLLARRMARSGEGLMVKLAERPDGRTTAKAESDGVAGIAGHANRERARRSAEIETLSWRSEEDQD